MRSFLLLAFAITLFISQRAHAENTAETASSNTTHSSNTTSQEAQANASATIKESEQPSLNQSTNGANETTNGATNNSTHFNESSSNATATTSETNSSTGNKTIIPVVEGLTTLNNNMTRNMSASGCHIFEFKADYRKSFVKITSDIAVHKFVLTDTVINNCDNELNVCGTNHTLCSKRADFSSLAEEVGKCLGNFYAVIQFQGSPSVQNANFTVHYEHVDDVPCFAPKTSDLDIYCGSLDPAVCGDTSGNCDKYCQYVQCEVENKPVLKLCFPISPTITADKCEISETFKKSPSNSSFYFQKCGYKKNEAVFMVKGISGLSILLIIMLVLVFIFFLVVVCYRWKLKTSRIAPFTPPNCCPEWIFPRLHNDEETYEAMDFNLDQNQGNYQPPKF